MQSIDSITRNEDYGKTVKKMEDALAQYDCMIPQIDGLNKRAKENIKIYYTNAILLKLKELETNEQDYFINQIKNRKMEKNIKVRSFKQLIKRAILSISIKMYIKMR